jgi:hypothetical protein
VGNERVKEKKFLRQLFKILGSSQIEKIQLPYADDEMVTDFSDTSKFRILNMSYQNSGYNN